jgi:type I restriction enzyme S subunit
MPYTYDVIQPVEVGKKKPDVALQNVCAFNIKKGTWNPFNNFADLPLRIGDCWLPNSEFVYQMFKFSGNIVLQNELLQTGGGPRRTSLVRKKTRSNRFANRVHEEFSEARPKLMEWIVRLKFAQHYDYLSPLLDETGKRDIAEYAVHNHDRYWGVDLDEGNITASGENKLGKIIMDIRDDYFENKDSIKQVAPSGLNWLRIFTFNCNVGFTRNDTFI